MTFIILPHPKCVRRNGSDQWKLPRETLMNEKRIRKRRLLHRSDKAKLYRLSIFHLVFHANGLH